MCVKHADPVPEWLLRNISGSVAIKKQKFVVKTREDWKQDPMLSSFACNWTS